MSVQEVLEIAVNTTPKPSEPTSGRSMEELFAEASLLSDDELKTKLNEMYKPRTLNFLMAKEFSESAKYVPSWLLKKNCEQEFDPKLILSYMTAINSDKKVMYTDIKTLVKLAIEKGNNLEKMILKSSPEFKHELKRLIKKYNLVSKAKNSKSAMTLSRISESVPIFTCTILKNEAENPIVSFELMETICKNYPRVMMTPAFAYLIPNKEDEFCLFLKKAHLLHRYQFFAKMSKETHPSSSIDVENEFISKVYANTQAAINGSHEEYDVQIKFLKENNLIEEVENEITVTEVVLEAVKLWDEKERQHELEQKFSGVELDNYHSFI
ncbi:uncharacterized protein LOC111041548 [Myzus persicae]|uniref:uncharacterized protein LOC111041548 n=1 Tax=Myzus persicae TaxID=13164 RepID=UPI000B930533|nr:uncharacterized protein LOC111041548 [Myzus persicae]